jgi:hypothetical protein
MLKKTNLIMYSIFLEFWISDLLIFANGVCLGSELKELYELVITKKIGIRKWIDKVYH